MMPSSLKIKPGLNFNRIIIVLLMAVPVISLFNCAKQGSPTGGPKDVDPPVAVQEIPPQKTVHFNESSITIIFNEFIQLKDQAKEIFISPPMKTKPEYKVQGKKLLVEFQEELKPNATYTINFGKAIVDFTEANPLVNYEYVFSTGDKIDSLYVPGIILDAFTHKPVEGVLAMVYMDDNDTIPLDSLPFKVPPKSASRTTKEGTFSINNLPPGQFLLFALEDMNNNFIFDLPNERIAFLDSLVTLVPPAPDTAEVVIDTAGIEAPVIKYVMPDYTLYLFEQSDSTQKFLGKKTFGKNLIQYYYRMPVDSFSFTPVSFHPERPDWYFTECSKNRDTIGFWLRPGIPDTIRVRMAAGDSLIDTSRFILSDMLQEKAGRRKEAKTAGIVILTELTGGTLDLNRNFALKFPVPVVSYDSSRLILNTPGDTLIPAFSFTDSLRRKLEINYKWMPGEIYSLAVDDSAFCDLSSHYNDSLVFRFKVRTPEDYGTLIINLQVPGSSGQFICQLLTDKEFFINEKTISQPGIIRFEYLIPSNYLLKVIYDVNKNGKWDPGNYSRKQMPEKVEYFSTPVSIRANWELQEDWKLE